MRDSSTNERSRVVAMGSLFSRQYQATLAGEEADRVVAGAVMAIDAIEDVGAPRPAVRPCEPPRRSVTLDVELHAVVDRAEDVPALEVLHDVLLLRLSERGRKRDRDAGDQHGRGGGDRDPARSEARARRRLHTVTESSRQRGHEQRDRCEQQEIRGPSGHEQAPERARLDGRSLREALHDEECRQPPAEQGRDRAAS